MSDRSGVLVVDKAGGVTSFDAVALVRRRLGLRRVGHAGTLDPAATGVLPVLVGEATKLVPYLQDADKEYVAVVRLGVTTDTLDLSGRVRSTAAVPPLTRTQVEAACRRFVGRIRQTPPMYSAVHHDGRRLYELARAGIEVERAPREVVVRALTLEALDPPTLTLRIVCGKGTYVRAIAADLGGVLGCGAALERLRRTRVGPFEEAVALPWEDLEAADAATLWARVLPPDRALAGWPVAVLGRAAAAAFVSGQPVEAAGVTPAALPEPPGSGRALIRVHDEGGRLLGVGETATGGRRVRPVRVLHADRPGPRVLPA